MPQSDRMPRSSATDLPSSSVALYTRSYPTRAQKYRPRCQSTSLKARRRRRPTGRKEMSRYTAVSSDASSDSFPFA